MQESYWSRFRDSRISRRRALALTGGTALGAAFLAACGGSDSGNSSDGGGSSGPKDNSGLLTQMKYDQANAKRGGQMIGVHPGVILSWDPFKTGINIRGGRRGFSQLFRIQDGVVENTKGAIEGDLAESWELSPDKLTLTIKLDGGAGLPPIAPVNGRVIDSADVLFTWERMKKQGTFRTELSNELNPGAPIVSMTAPDAKTVVVKLSEPNATISRCSVPTLSAICSSSPKKRARPGTRTSRPSARGPSISPTTPRSRTAGSATRTSSAPSSRTTSPTSTRFRAGHPRHLGRRSSVPLRRRLLVRRQRRQHRVDQARHAAAADVRDAAADTGTERIYFGQNADSPFKDERIRIAYMKSIDRDSFIIAAHNTDRFAKEGLPVSEFWEAGLGAGTWTGWYLDPKDEKAFGPNAKNYKYDLAEAKKLVEAAGLKTPLDITALYAQQSPTSFPASFYKRSEIFLGMIENSGVFKMKRDLITYQDWNTEKVRFSGGKFSGATWGPDTATGDPAANAFFLYNSKGGYYQGGDAKMDEITNKARAEFDDKKRQELVLEAQRYNGAHFWNNKIGTAGGFALQWPIIVGQQQSIFRGGTNWMDLRAYLDPTQPPKKA